jgi:hypothetical protein
MNCVFATARLRKVSFCLKALQTNSNKSSAVMTKRAYGESKCSRAGMYMARHLR